MMLILYIGFTNLFQSDANLLSRLVSKRQVLIRSDTKLFQP